MAHCHNCQLDTDLVTAEDPDGREYSVCEKCVQYIEAGTARVVKHRQWG